MWAGIGTVGLAVGPLVGGFLTQALSWRWFFFVNIPVAVLAIVLTLVAVRESKDEGASPRVDLVGLLTITVGLAALVLAIQQSDTLGWGSALVIGSLIVALILLGLFLFVEPRLPDTRHDERGDHERQAARGVEKDQHQERHRAQRHADHHRRARPDGSCQPARERVDHSEDRREGQEHESRL